MATKLRKFSYGILMKSVIFLITVGCIAMAGRAVFRIAVSDSLFCRNYGADYHYDNDFLSSWTFADMLERDIDKISRYAERYHGDEEYVNSGQAWSDYEAELKDDSAKATEREINDKIKYYIDYYSVYSEEVNGETPSMSDDGAEETTVASSSNGEAEYTLEYAKQVLSSDYYAALEREIESINSSNNSTLKSNISYAQTYFLSDYESLKNEISSIKSLKFIYDNGNIFLTNIDGAEKKSDKNYSEYVLSLPISVTADGMVNGSNIFLSEIAEKITSNGNLSIGIDTDMISAGTADEKYTKAAAAYDSMYYDIRDEVIGASVSGLIALAGIIYLIVTAGRKDKNEPVEEAAIDRCFHDIHFLISGGIIFLVFLAVIFLIDSVGFYSEEILKYENIVTAIMFAASLVILEWFLSLVRAIKARTLIKHSLWYVILRKIAGFFRKCRKKIRAAFDSGYHFKCLKKSVLFKAVLFFGINGLLLLIGAVSAYSGDGSVFFILFLLPAVIFNTAFLAATFKTIKNLDKIFAEIRKGAQGNFNFTLDYSRMKEPVRGFARDVENMQQGLKIAVEDAIKGERMKTELITNVSHDLKTPLTSIINYVDLLSRCDITDETAKEYIGVLSDKSAKLKKLIEDLVEASKASTGNVKINKIKMNLYELAVQAVGEHEDALSERGIEVRINTPEKQPVVLADNQKTWRIIDNLFSNVKKYSLKGSRAYITVDEKDGWGRFSIKNISEKALDISPDELTQRFVRGDASRSTEGSGLGLSIAKSLCELQGGRFTIEIDGDLFKATVELPLVSGDEEKNKNSLLEQEKAQRYAPQGANLNASFNFPPDLKVSEQMAEELRRRQIDASQNLAPPKDKK